MRDIFKETLAEPKRESGAPILLFDRLTNESPEIEQENPIKRFYNKLELIQSIEREVYRILNTRATIKHDEFDELKLFSGNIGLPQMFGLADFSQYDGANSGHYLRIAKLCEISIGTYESRLSNIKVTIINFDKQNQTLNANITALINIPEFRQEITFPMAIEI